MKAAVSCLCCEGLTATARILLWMCVARPFCHLSCHQGVICPLPSKSRRRQLNLRDGTMRHIVSWGESFQTAFDIWASQGKWSRIPDLSRFLFHTYSFRISFVKKTPKNNNNKKTPNILLQFMAKTVFLCKDQPTGDPSLASVNTSPDTGAPA